MDTPVPSHVPSLIAAHMRASAGRTPGGRVGPFIVGLDPHSDDPMRNYAVPEHGACPDVGDTTALIAFFRRSQRIPRLEYIEDSAPRAWPALAAAGFTIERRTPVMIATPGTRLTPRSPAGTTLRQTISDEDLTAAATVQHDAYQMPCPPGPHDIARLTRLTQRGGLVAIAVDDSSGTVTGTGLVDVTGDRPPSASSLSSASCRHSAVAALPPPSAPTSQGPPTPRASAWSSWKPSQKRNRSTGTPGSPTPPPKSGPRSADTTTARYGCFREH